MFSLINIFRLQRFKQIIKNNSNYGEISLRLLILYNGYSAPKINLYYENYD